MNSDQFELVIPPRPTDDILRERLAEFVERFNCEVDPAQRVFLHTEISELRRILKVSKGALRHERTT